MKSFFSIFFLIFTITIFADEEISTDEFKSILNKIISSHPEVKSIDSKTHSLGAESRHAKTLPDPKIGLSMRNYPYYGKLGFDDNRINTPSMTGREISLSQEIPSFGKRTMNKKIIEHKRKEAMFDGIFIRNRLAKDLLLSEIRKRALEEKLQIYSKLGELYNSIENITRVYNSSGKKQFYDTLIVSANKTGNSIKLIEVESDLETFKAELDHLGFGKKDEMEEFYKSNIYTFLEKTFSEIYTDLKNHEVEFIQKNPILSQKREEKLRAIDEKILNQYLVHLPEAEIFVSYMKRNNQTYMLANGPISSATGNWMLQDSTEYRGDLFSMGVTFKIPFWSLLSYGNSKEMNKENIKSVEESLEKEKRILSANLKKLMTQKILFNQGLQIIKTKLIPELENASKSANETYKAGKINFADVLSTRIELQMAKLNEIEVKERYYSSIVEIIELTNSIL